MRECTTSELRNYLAELEKHHARFKSEYRKRTITRKGAGLFAILMKFTIMNKEGVDAELARRKELF